MTALVMSQSRQRNAQTHNVKVTCSHRQKMYERRQYTIYVFTISIFLVISSLTANSGLSIIITQK